MKIALLAPFEERVPPKKYGGIEVVVHALAEELHRLGHDVTLFASGDSKISGRVIPIVPKAIGSGQSKRIREAKTYQGLVEVAKWLQKEKFDVLHNHVGWQALLFKDFFPVPMLTTIHWVLDNPCENIMYGDLKDMPFVSISNNQRQARPDLNYVKTIYHGLDLAPFRYNPQPGSYLAFLGRFSPVKGPLEAIEIAKRTGNQLLMAAKINDFERKFYDAKIKPLVDGKQIQDIGEVDLRGKVKLLSGAKALLSPISWEEPFGLTNIEAMACGSPVIGMKRGALPEIIKHGKTGFLCKTVDEMVQRVADLDTIEREDCRKHVEKHFTATRMAQDYLALYKKLARA